MCNMRRLIKNIAENIINILRFDRWFNVFDIIQLLGLYPCCPWSVLSWTTKYLESWYMRLVLSYFQSKNKPSLSNQISLVQGPKIKWLKLCCLKIFPTVIKSREMSHGHAKLQTGYWFHLIFNTLRPRQNGRHFAYFLHFQCIFLNKDFD